MKKIALQLYGHLRSCKETYNSLFNNVVRTLCDEGYSVDIFLHTWNKTDTSERSWHNPNGDKRGHVICGEDIEFIKKAYNPKMFLIDEQIKVEQDFEFSERLFKTPRQYSAIINYMYTKYKVNELRLEYEQHNGIEYEYVIQTRPDIKFIEPFGIQNLLSLYKEQDIIIPKNALFCTGTPFGRGPIEADIFVYATDLIIFASPSIMNKINCFYKDIETGKITKEWILENCYHFEALWLLYWKMLDVDMVRLKYLIEESYKIVRNVKEHEKLPATKNVSILKKLSDKNFMLKILRKCLKILPYFCIRRIIVKLDAKIR